MVLSRCEGSVAATSGSDDQQDPCWLLLTLKDKTGRPWGKEAQRLAQFWQFPLASNKGDAAEGSDLIQQCLGVCSDFIFH